MNVQGPIELVVFDLGRVLIRIVDDWRGAADAAGVAWSADGRSDAWSQALAINTRYEVGDIDHERFCDEVARATGVAGEHVDAMSTAWLRGPYPGSLDVVRRVIDAGVTTACLSNTCANHWNMMIDPGHDNYVMLDRLHHRFASHLVGIAKPYAGIYEHVERETGIAPGATLFFDDSVPNVETARSRGWRAELIADDGDPAAQMNRHLRAYGVS